MPKATCLDNSPFLPLNVVDVGGPMIYDCAVRLLDSYSTAVVVIMLNLLYCRPTEDIWSLVHGDW